MNKSQIVMYVVLVPVALALFYGGNLISPILGCFSEIDFSAYTLNVGKLSLKYGAFLTDVINFIIMAFVVFIIIKAVNKVLAKKPEPQEEMIEIESDEVKILKEIRDELKKSKKN